MKKSNETEKSEIVLFTDKAKCCGCGVCMNVCSQNAISMEADEEGFLYPVINQEKCINCGLCTLKCAYQNDARGTLTQEAYAASTTNEELLEKSASGGIFSALAAEMLKYNGSVFGCSMEVLEGILTPMHIKVENVNELTRLQGSKYVQSITGTVYQEVKAELQQGKYVLFSGTPCQVAGLKKYLGTVQYEKLFTIDIICHGVPNVKFFQGYIQEYQKRLGGTIVALQFRDKTSGWGLKGKVKYLDKNGKQKEKIMATNLSSYYKLFLKSEIYRESCYSCKYAGKNRVGDITIGDYWGIKQEHSEYLENNGGNLNEEKGISCVLINNEQGKKLIRQFGACLLLNPSEFSKVAKKNQQLNKPSHSSKNREEILRLFKEGGYLAVDRWFYKQLGVKRYIYVIWNKIPTKLQRFLRKSK